MRQLITALAIGTLLLLCGSAESQRVIDSRTTAPVLVITTVGGYISMTSPGGTKYHLTVANDGALLVTAE